MEAKLSPQRKAEIQGLVALLAPTIADFVIAAIAQRRIEQLESKPQLRYLETWKEGQVYGSGSFITDGGSCWYAQRASVGEGLERATLLCSP
jgi:hypothetical protein